MALAFAAAPEDAMDQPEAIANPASSIMRPLAIGRARAKAGVGGEPTRLRTDAIDRALLTIAAMRHDRLSTRMSDEELDAVACGGDSYVNEFDRELLVVSNAVALTTLLERR